MCVFSECLMKPPHTHLYNTCLLRSSNTNTNVCVPDEEVVLEVAVEGGAAANVWRARSVLIVVKKNIVYSSFSKQFFFLRSLTLGPIFRFFNKHLVMMQRSLGICAAVIILSAPVINYDCCTSALCSTGAVPKWNEHLLDV